MRRPPLHLFFEKFLQLRELRPLRRVGDTPAHLGQLGTDGVRAAPVLGLLGGSALLDQCGDLGGDAVGLFAVVQQAQHAGQLIKRLGGSLQRRFVGGDILIADEILSVGDFLFQEKCEKRMAELLSGGTTVILVSHSIDQIERMCNKVAWLDHGHLRRIGATKEITAEYRRFEKKDAMPAKVTEE